MAVEPQPRYFQRYISPAPLAVFRIAFGLLILASVVRFWAKGWIAELYLQPKFFFPYYGLEFIKPLGPYTYGLFAVCGVCALLVALGWHYRPAAAGLFLSFTYIELMDKSTYLNHYYFVSLVALLLVFLPAEADFSLDAARRPARRHTQVPRWAVDALRLLVGIVYVYAGLAKLNSDWLLAAAPLRIWLPAKNDLPMVGFLFNYPATAYVFSWFGAFYDLTVPFFLLNRLTRPYAYAAVVGFHVLTAILFPIGMFPYVMIVAALVFFPADFHERLLARVRRWLRLGVEEPRPAAPLVYRPRVRLALLIGFALFFVVQLLAPLRYWLYPRELFWTEEGYRFSWRVMLMEKLGQVQFKVVDGATGRARLVNNAEHLSVLQEKMMATQADMMLQFAHYLHDYYTRQGVRNPQVYADAYVSLNGRLGQAYIDPTVDLARQTEGFAPKPWILPFNDEITGL
ncbi:HTTM domain-containing protein [Hymenobacter glaciei]|uniref:HTTM domain-containing protein n=1 Tax=Hymenobacter glaciei TaxID=877209 RepID=A0ABP7UP97_9BACT